jgi:hypothetical protein
VGFIYILIFSDDFCLKEVQLLAQWVDVFWVWPLGPDSVEQQKQWEFVGTV